MHVPFSMHGSRMRVGMSEKKQETTIHFSFISQLKFKANFHQNLLSFGFK